MRITAACPQLLQSDANQLAMCLALGPDDINTYAGLNWQDAYGKLYACASWLTTPNWITAAQQTLVRPAWDTDNIINMEAATRAQGKLVFSDTAIIATPDTLTACLGDNGLLVIKGMGLTSVEAEDGFMGE